MTTATIHETSPRASDWMHVFGRLNDIPLRGPFAIKVNVPGRSSVSAYLLDVSLLTAEERLRLVNHIANRFNLPPAEVDRDLDAQGVPVLAEDVLVSVPQGLAFSMMDEVDPFDLEEEDVDWDADDYDDEDIYLDDEDDDED